MKTEYLSSFARDLGKIKDTQTLRRVKQAIERIEQAENLRDVSNIKKLTGSKDAYRLRVGDYRLGFFVDDEVVQFARVLYRSEVYHRFPE